MTGNKHNIIGHSEAIRSSARRPSPLEHPLAIGTFEQDERRYKDLRTRADRYYHLLLISDEVSEFRCLRDIRVIYDIELPVMACLLGIDVSQLEEWEKPDVCQNRRASSAQGEVISDIRRLTTVLEFAGFSVGEVGPIITQDITEASNMVHTGKIPAFVNACDPM